MIDKNIYIKLIFGVLIASLLMLPVMAADQKISISQATADIFMISTDTEQSIAKIDTDATLNWTYNGLQMVWSPKVDISTDKDMVEQITEAIFGEGETIIEAQSVNDDVLKTPINEKISISYEFYPGKVKETMTLTAPADRIYYNYNIEQNKIITITEGDAINGTKISTITIPGKETSIQKINVGEYENINGLSAVGGLLIKEEGQERIFYERPFAIDNAGRRYQLDFLLNEQDKSVDIIGDLSTAQYPISIDPTGNIVSTTTTNISGQTILTFRYSATGGNTTWTAPSGISSVWALVVGGGGSGGGYVGGGGGAGGLINQTISVSPGTTYDVYAGAGGIAASSNQGNNGSYSQFSTLIAYGGGHGSVGGVATNGGNYADNGGSGGGGAGSTGYWTGGSNVSGQGFPGGSSTSNAAGNGGGGAGASGINNNKQGGIGKQINITGLNLYYAGGGSGGDGETTTLAGGLGGGGMGGTAHNSDGTTITGSTAGTDGLGGGGGGGCYGTHGTNYNQGSNGGSGIVVIRYSNPEMGASFSSNATNNYIGNYQDVLFSDTSSGTTTGWQWLATNTIGNNTQTTFSTSQYPTAIRLLAGNWSIALNVTNGTANSMSAAQFVNISPRVLKETIGIYTVETYTDVNGEFNWSAPADVQSNAEIVVVGGGGAGNGALGGGGGGGGMINQTITIVPNTGYNIIVGNGGYNSSFGSYVAMYGGQGGADHSAGLNGGSGGGGGTPTNPPSSQYGYTAGGTTTIAGQGYAGGRGAAFNGATWGSSGGGGGAGGVGGEGQPAEQGTGGSGRATSINGTSITYSAGGGVGSSTPVNSGNGGNNAAGASGIVIIKYTQTVPIIVDYTTDATYGNMPLTIQFTDISGGTPTSWNWSFGDGTYSTTQSPSHTYSSGGNYTVALNASNAGNSNISASRYITVYNTTHAQFTGTPTSGLMPLSVTFNVTYAYDNATYWNWSFGDGNWQNGTVQNATHTYSSGGTYTVSERATNDYDTDSYTLNNYITVYNITSASFTQDKTSGYIYLPVQFTGTAINGTTYNWSFGDGETSTSLSPEHTYMSVGTFSVNFSVSNPYHTSWYNMSDLITTTLPPAPVTNFTGSPLSGATGLVVSFVDNSSNDPTSWNWNFGDGTANFTSTNSTLASHTYSSAGIYNVSLISSNLGGSGYMVRDYYIMVSAPPVSNFTGTPTIGYTPFNVQFNDTSTGIPTAWTWNFGDGTATNATQNPVHTYTTDGQFTVSLTVSNYGGTDGETKNAYITSITTPEGDFTGTPTLGPNPLTVKFTDTSTHTPTSWSWDFGDGTYSVLQNPTHTFATGIYTVSMIATNAAGSSAPAVKVNYITSTTIPFANFSATPTMGITNLSVVFTDQTTNLATSWDWSFGDGTTSTVQNPTHTYSTEGIYNVTLVSGNIYGSDTVTKMSYIQSVTPAHSITTDNVVVTTDGGQYCAEFNGYNYGSTTTGWFEYGSATTSGLNPSGYKPFKTKNQTIMPGNYSTEICGIPLMPGKTYVVSSVGAVGSQLIYGSNKTFTMGALVPHATTTYTEFSDKFTEDGGDPIELLTVDPWLVYTGLWGSGLFFGLLIAFIYFNVVIKQRGVIITIILSLVTGGAAFAFLPSAFLQVAQILVIAGFAGVVYWIFFRRQ